MNKLNFLMVFVCVTLVFPMVMRAQTNVLHRVFDYTTSFPYSDIKYHKMLEEDDADLTFTYCWAVKGEYLQVGSSTDDGIVKINPLGLNGNATVVIRATGLLGAAQYRVSAIGSGEVYNGEISLADGEERLDAILIKNMNAQTQLCIEGVNGRLELISIDVFSTNDFYFYESFNNMVATNHVEFGINSNETLAPSSKCDNCTGSIEECRQSERCIYMYDYSTSKYITPPTVLSSGNMALLSFKLARKATATPSKLILSCDGEAKMSPFNTESLSDMTNSRTISQDILPGLESWSDYFVVVTNMSNTTQFTFQGEQMYLDNIKLTPYAVLDEGVNNTLTIANNLGRYNVTLTRTLGTGYWNTLCLPFDITKASFEEATGANTEIQTLASVNNGVFRFDDIAADATIEAGTPFIVKVSRQVTNPQFRNVVITDTGAKAMPENESYQFVGTYSPVQLKIDKKELFLGIDGKLHYPSSADVSTMKGLRAYFVVPTGAVTTRVNINGEEMDAIDALDAPEAEAVVYDLRGQRHHPDDLQKGVYICDGRKVIVK